MNNQSNNGLQTFTSTGSPQYEKLRLRALELAVVNGRPSNNPSGADLAQARRELSGKSDNTAEIE